LAFDLVKAASLDELDGGLPMHGGTEVVPLLRDGILETTKLVDIRGVVPRGVRGNRVGAGTTLAELEVDPEVPDALREACRLAASPQLRNMSSIGGNLLQATRCWYWRLKYPCRLHGGDRCHARDGEHREHAIFANDYCASAHPSDIAAVLLALDARLHTTQRELALTDLYGLPSDEERDITRLAPGELILEIELPPVEASVYLNAMDRKRWSFPQVGVAAARTAAGTRIALSGVAPIPWLLDGPEGLDAATPLPRTAWKVDVARALVRRAVAAVSAQ
jgi:xanthine dehydrogenase YagS FAD-binding subunit